MEGKRVLFLLLLLLTGCVSSPTGDLYTNQVSNKATGDAAIQLAQFQSEFLTGTAQAPIIHITETAAGMAIQQQYWTTTAQSIMDTQTAALTATAMSWTATPNATSTAVAMMAQAEGTRIANDTELNNLALARQQANNELQADLPYLAAFVVPVLFLGWALITVSRREKFKKADVDDRGNVIPILNVVDGTYTDVDRNPNYRGLLGANSFQRWLDSKLKLPPLLPEITAKRQDETTQRDQLLDLATRGLPGGNPNQSAQKKLAGQEMMKQLSASNLEGRFKIVDDTTNLDVIDAEIQVLDSVWKEGEK